MALERADIVETLLPYIFVLQGAGQLLELE